MKILLFILFSIPMLANASVDLEFISPNEMLSESDFIGIVKIESGEANKSGFKLVGKLVSSLKGSNPNKITFGHSLFIDGNRYTDYPDRLGGTYLVFLSGNENNLMTINQHYSVIEVKSISSDRSSYDDIFGYFNLEMNDLKKVGNTYWFPTECQNGSGEICSLVKSLFTAAFNQRLH